MPGIAKPIQKCQKHVKRKKSSANQPKKKTLPGVKLDIRKNEKASVEIKPMSMQDVDATLKAIDNNIFLGGSNAEGIADAEEDFEAPFDSVPSKVG